MTKSFDDLTNRFTYHSEEIKNQIQYLDYLSFDYYDQLGYSFKETLDNILEELDRLNSIIRDVPHV